MTTTDDLRPHFRKSSTCFWTHETSYVQMVKTAAWVGLALALGSCEKKVLVDRNSWG